MRADVSSGDAVADRQLGERFSALYNESHKVATRGDGKAILQIGKNEWPLPIPMASRGKPGTSIPSLPRTRSSTGASAQRVVHHPDRAGDCRRPAGLRRQRPQRRRPARLRKKFRSSPGKHDGLYWPAKAGEEQSPLGPLAAQAAGQGYFKRATGKPEPYHGYFFRILTGQGKGARAVPTITWSRKR